MFYTQELLFVPQTTFLQLKLIFLHSNYFLHSKLFFCVKKLILHYKIISFAKLFPKPLLRMKNIFRCPKLPFSAKNYLFARRTTFCIKNYQFYTKRFSLGCERCRWFEKSKASKRRNHLEPPLHLHATFQPLSSIWGKILVGERSSKNS